MQTGFNVDCFNVDLNAHPRIVSQSPYLTYALEWLGRGECIVGVSRYDHRDLPRTGGILDPDAQAIAALRPDLLVASDWADGDAMRRATPPGARLLRVGGFRSIADMEAMLLTLARESGAAAGEEQIAALHAALLQRAGVIQGNGKRVLLVSACTDFPYSFGHGHFLGEVFTLAGFDVVETAAQVRHLCAGEEIPDLAAAVNAFKPDIVFALNEKSAARCQMELASLPIQLIALSRESFFHPGPNLLKGLDELAEKIQA